MLVVVGALSNDHLRYPVGKRTEGRTCSAVVHDRGARGEEFGLGDEPLDPCVRRKRRQLGWILIVTKLQPTSPNRAEPPDTPSIERNPAATQESNLKSRAVRSVIDRRLGKVTCFDRYFKEERLIERLPALMSADRDSTTTPRGRPRPQPAWRDACRCRTRCQVRARSCTFADGAYRARRHVVGRIDADPQPSLAAARQHADRRQVTVRVRGDTL